MRRLGGLLVLVALAAGACGGGGDAGPRTHTAQFSRAIQLFPGSPVRVLGVDVGLVTDLRPTLDGVEVEFTIDDPDIQIPADVEAAIVPASLLGERYVQLFPAYEGGATLENGATIPISRTGVPSEPDELLRSLQDYLGALDPEVVSEFVHNAAVALDGTGTALNELIHRAARVLATLSAKRDDLATIVVQFDRLSRALSTRQAAIGRLIHSYNAVAGTVVTNRSAVEGTIEGLNEMSAELAALLIEHRDPLNQDIDALTRTGRTLDRNLDDLTQAGHWAERLFRAASIAVDFDRDWLRLNNQGEPLGALIVMRLRQRLTEFCTDLVIEFCATPGFWSANAPSLFCFEARCPQASGRRPEEQLTRAIEEAPALARDLLDTARELACADAPDPAACQRDRLQIVRCLRSDHPQRCLERHQLLELCRDGDRPRACLERRRHQDLRRLVKDLLDRTVGNPEGLGGVA